VALAQAALDDPGTHASAAIELAEALGGEVLAAWTERLGATLAGWPDVRASFFATWR
jgi:hypothetical protein